MSIIESCDEIDISVPMHFFHHLETFLTDYLEGGESPRECQRLVEALKELKAFAEAK